MPDIKEPSFYCKPFQVIKNPLDYYSLFSPVKNETAIGEASHIYMTNPPTAEVLKTLYPDAKFIITLRNPVNRAYSLYHWMVRHKHEQAKTFEEAIELEYYRNSCAGVCPQYYYNFMYVGSSKYSPQLIRYLRLFPNYNQFYFTTLTDITNITLTVVRNIFKFLSVDEQFIPRLPKHKSSRYPEMKPETRKKLALRFAGDILETECLIHSELGDI